MIKMGSEYNERSERSERSDMRMKWDKISGLKGKMAPFELVLGGKRVKNTTLLGVHLKKSHIVGEKYHIYLGFT